ncbi:MAG: hypothetical protein KTR26_15445 [Flammeovirgaceae bacterium]|nr:hypothetical protein [Flammeovirgaceae bacterium]
MPRRLSFKLKKRGKWETIATENIDPLARAALFKVTNWNDNQDIPYRLVYNWSETGENPLTHYQSVVAH